MKHLAKIQAEFLRRVAAQDDVPDGLRGVEYMKTTAAPDDTSKSDDVKKNAA